MYFCGKVILYHNTWDKKTKILYLFLGISQKSGHRMNRGECCWNQKNVKIQTRALRFAVWTGEIVERTLCTTELAAFDNSDALF